MLLNASMEWMRWPMRNKLLWAPLNAIEKMVKLQDPYPPGPSLIAIFIIGMCSTMAMTSKHTNPLFVEPHSWQFLPICLQQKAVLQSRLLKSITCFIKSGNGGSNF